MLLVKIKTGTGHKAQWHEFSRIEHLQAERVLTEAGVGFAHSPHATLPYGGSNPLAMLKASMAQLEVAL